MTTNRDRQIQMVEDACHNPWKYGVAACSLCSDVAISTTVLFVPNETFAKKIGEPKGKQRVMVYALCERCFELPDRDDKVERAILADMQVQ
jgi:hypothetical protein